MSLHHAPLPEIERVEFRIIVSRHLEVHDFHRSSISSALSGCMMALCYRFMKHEIPISQRAYAKFYVASGTFVQV